jgi:cytochrome c5
MKKAIVLSASIALIATGAAVGANPAPPTGTVTISLPGDDGMSFKTGQGVETAQRYCLTCHSSALVATQPFLTAAQWTAEVNKMKAVYGAPIPDDQVSTIADYLTAQYGKH